MRMVRIIRGLTLALAALASGRTFIHSDPKAATPTPTPIPTLSLAIPHPNTNPNPNPTPNQVTLVLSAAVPLDQLFVSSGADSH